jgi:hypothetical protein
LTTLPLNKVHFCNNRFGWIIGGYSNNDDFLPILFRTEDGANTWEEVTGLEYMIHDFHFQDSLHGWAVGENYLKKGVILETNDGGLNWDVVTDQLRARLISLHKAVDFGWAVGEGGLILKYHPVITYEEPVSIKPETYQFDIYPNPFYQKAIITYEVPKEGMVHLCIYNLTGDFVSQLVNLWQPVGKYRLDWDNSGLSAGVYLCALSTPAGRQVLKIIKIR